MSTPCKSSTSTVASPKRSSVIAMNNEKSFSSETNSPKRSSYVASNNNNNVESTLIKINSPRRLPSVAMNNKRSPSRKINSSTSSPIIFQRCFSREVHSPQRSSSTTTSGFDKSGEI